MIRVSIENNLIVVRSPYTPECVAAAKKIPGGKYLPALHAWSYPKSALSEIRRAYNGSAQYAPALLDMFMAERTDAEVWRATSTETLAAVLPDGRKLFDHQRTGIFEMIARRKCILADDMGLGKTLQALIAARWWRDYRACAIVLVAPVSLHRNWQREARAVGIYIHTTYSWAAREMPSPGVPFVLIADEAHYAQSLKSARTKKFLALASEARACYALTGTPIKNGHPHNLLPLLIAVEHPLAADRRAFEARYCNARVTRFSRWDTTGATNLQELHQKLKGTIIRRLKSECLDLPAKMRVFTAADVAAADWERYDKAVREAVAEYEQHRGSIEHAEGLLMKERHAGSMAKIPATVELLEEIHAQGGQAVVFTQFLDVAAELSRVLECDALTGAVPLARRDAMTLAFQRGETKTLVITMAGGVGINLFAAQNIILVDRPWTPGDAEQIEDRLHRIGQCGTVTATWLQYGKIDERIDDILDTKKSRISTVLHGHTDSIYNPSTVRQIALDLAEELTKQ